MSDTLDPATRSRTMAAVKSRGTVVELRVRRSLHSAGLRYRLHRKDLPGSPDVVLPSLRTIVFVHGCFWHRHAGCKRASTPASHTEYWLPKLARNVQRDRVNSQRLADLGWTVLVVWECQATPDQLASLANQLLSRREILRAAPVPLPHANQRRRLGRRAANPR